jgi:predicted RNase H-like HicB family nuclease
MEFNIHIEWTEKNACAYIDEVPGFIIASKTVESLQNEIREALEFHVDGCLKAAERGRGNKEQWFTERHEWRFIYHYDLGALLNLYSGVLNQSNLARITGVNISLMRHYLCGLRNPSKKRLALIEKKLRTFASDLYNIRLS